MRSVLRVKAPEELAKRQVAAQERLADLKTEAAERAQPRLVTLTFTGAGFAQYQAALGKARGVIRQAQETVGMLTELSDAEVVTVAAALRTARNGAP